MHFGVFRWGQEFNCESVDITPSSYKSDNLFLYAPIDLLTFKMDILNTNTYNQSRIHVLFNFLVFKTSYNPATAKLAFHSNETSKDKLSII